MTGYARLCQVMPGYFMLWEVRTGFVRKCQVKSV